MLAASIHRFVEQNYHRNTFGQRGVQVGKQAVGAFDEFCFLQNAAAHSTHVAQVAVGKQPFEQSLAHPGIARVTDGGGTAPGQAG